MKRLYVNIKQRVFVLPKCSINCQPLEIGSFHRKTITRIVKTFCEKARASQLALK